MTHHAALRQTRAMNLMVRPLVAGMDISEKRCSDSACDTLSVKEILLRDAILTGLRRLGFMPSSCIERAMPVSLDSTTGVLP
jgi:hypothetical protein